MSSFDETSRGGEFVWPPPRDFLREIPKSDLHVHLDGSLRIETLLELAREKGIALPAEDVESLRAVLFKSNFTSLEDYLQCFNYTGAVMSDVESVERVAYEFAIDNYEEGVRYFEVRFSPQLLASASDLDKFSCKDVIHAVHKGLDRAAAEFNARISLPAEPPYDFGIILSAMRAFPPGTKYFGAMCSVLPLEMQERLASLASMELVRTAASCKLTENLNRIVAIDVAGPEHGFPNSAHREAFDLAGEYFLRRTVHAGEGFGPQSILQAVRDLNADRIGHGFHLFSEDKVNRKGKLGDLDSAAVFVRQLVKYVCDNRICLEVCLTSNLNTMPELTDIKKHSFRKMLDEGVSVCLNTDNRLVSNTSMTRELELAVSAFELSPAQLKEIVMTGFWKSFYHGKYTDKVAYMNRLSQYYDSIAEKYGIPCQYQTDLDK
jgi:adenosine deaminase